MSDKVKDYIDKMTRWKAETKKLRSILRETKLTEHLKWNKPCYCYNESNIAIIQPFKDKLGLMFFKGKLLKDSQRMLIENGVNSQSAMRLEFSSVEDVITKKPNILQYLDEAILLEINGEKVKFKKKLEALPLELESALENNSELKKAFLSLTPGRQRGYILYISGAKQSKTRTNRIEKCTPKILLRKGLQE